MVQKRIGKPKVPQADHEEKYRELIQLLGRLVAIRWREQQANPRIVQKPIRSNRSRPRKR